MAEPNKGPQNNESKKLEAEAKITNESKTASAASGSDDGKSSQAHAAPQQDAISLLKTDHRKVEGLFKQFENASRRAQKTKLVRQICQELIIHAIIEEEIFYPACRDHMEDKQLDEAQVEHDSAKTLINELLSGGPEDPFYNAKVAVLAEQVKHHIQEEEGIAESIFAHAKAAGVDTDAIAEKLRSRKAELMSRVEEDSLPRPKPRSFRIIGGKQVEENMGRYDRDEDRGYSQSRGSYRQEDDNRGRGRNTPDRDDQGRFVSDDDYRSGRSATSRSRYDEDRQNGGRSQSGWYGDSEGHSEASRRGWEHREDDGRSRHDEDDYRTNGGRNTRDRDDRGRFMSEDEGRGRYGQSGRGGYRQDEDDNRGRSRNMPDRDEYGRFMSDDDYRSSRESRSRQDEGRRQSGGRGQSGWYGDPEGHSEASRRGWEHREGTGRGSRDDEDRSYRSSNERGGYQSRSSYSRNQDEDSRQTGGRGGWFGDPEGHSEASRRGWDHRR